METLRFLMATSFYPPYHLGGDAVHVRYLAEALAERGHEVHVEFSPAAYRLKRRGPMPRADPQGAVHLHPIPSALGRAQPMSAYLFGRSRSVSRAHGDLVRTIRPEVVHLHNISLLGLGVMHTSPRALTVYTAHDYWLRCPRSDLLKHGKRPCEAPTCVSCCLASGKPPQLWRYARRWRGLRGVDLAIAPSRFMVRAIGPHVACPVLHIANFAPDPNPAGILSEGEDYYLFVGTLERHKGVDRLAEAARRGGFHVRLVGRGSLAGRLSSLHDAGSRNIVVEGWKSQAELQPLYERANALILPSVCQENAPLAALEGLAWGTPLLVSRRGGLEETLHYGVAGRSFEPTVEGILDAIHRFEETGLARRLRASSRAAYVTHHRPEVYLDRYLGALGDLDQARQARGEPSVVAGAPAPPPLEIAPGGAVS